MTRLGNSRRHSIVDGLLWCKLFVLSFLRMEASQVHKKLCVCAGVIITNVALVRAPLRSILLCCALTGTVLNASLLLLISRANVKLFIPDWVRCGPVGSHMLRATSRCAHRHFFLQFRSGPGPV